MEANGNGDLHRPISNATSAWDPNPTLPVPDTRGKHRISVELMRLQQEARFLQEELEEVEKIERVSAGLQELMHNIECRPDPLLPITTGPASDMWDQWFERPKQMRRCRCWII